MNKIPVVAVVGPTATGKTKLSVELAKINNGEIISADSMQVYRYLNIGTAKPTLSEMQGIKHYMIDIKDVTEDFSVAMYCKIVHNLIKQINEGGKLSFLVGGTGLYIDSLVNNIQFYEGKVNMEVRKDLNLKLREKGLQALIDELSEFDIESAVKMSEKNPKRIIRAIEFYRTTGVKMSDQIKSSQLQKSLYNTCFIGLNYRNRDKLYDSINKRVDKMIEIGLLNEAKWLLNLIENNKGKTMTAAGAIGYKELFPYLNGEKSLDEVVENLKQASRRYAKRQLTWFRKNNNINWIFIDDYSNFNDIIKAAQKIIEKY